MDYYYGGLTDTLYLASSPSSLLCIAYTNFPDIHLSRLLQKAKEGFSIVQMFKC